MGDRFFLRVADIAAATLTIVAASISIANATSTKEVSQRGRMFDPGEAELRAGDTLHIVNNDGDLLHHAYVDAPNFKFDSGEQEPGTSVDIVFTTRGSFEVLCGIHPKMHLAVTVK